MKSDIRQELLELQVLQGIDFVRQLKLIVSRKEFRPLDTDPEIFLVGGKDDADYPRLLDAARKAVALGYRVYMLPNPHGIRTADFIFERKGVYRMYDLKTVHGKSSVDTQLLDSIGQANRILLNMTSDYNPRTLAKDICSRISSRLRRSTRRFSHHPQQRAATIMMSSEAMTASSLTGVHHDGRETTRTSDGFLMTTAQFSICGKNRCSGDHDCASRTQIPSTSTMLPGTMSASESGHDEAYTSIIRPLEFRRMDASESEEDEMESTFPCRRTNCPCEPG